MSDGNAAIMAYSSEMLQKCLERTVNPRTQEIVSCVSEANTVFKRVRKDQCVNIQTAKTVIEQCKTDALNARVPQVAYHRIVNAVCLTSIKLNDMAIDPTGKIVYHAVNSKKTVYSTHKGNYATKNQIAAHSAPRFVKAVQIPAYRKLRITKSGKVKLKRF